MSYLLDTNVISEVVGKRPEPRVVAWLESIPNELVFLSVISVGELRQGVERLPSKGRREKLLVWLEHEIPAWFGSRLLPVDVPVADRWGRVLASSPRSLPAIDSLLAATALAHGLRLVTRNERDFEGIGDLEVVNPWKL